MEETHPDSGTGLRGGRMGQALGSGAVPCSLGLIGHRGRWPEARPQSNPRGALSGDLLV